MFCSPKQYWFFVGMAACVTAFAVMFVTQYWFVGGGYESADFSVFWEAVRWLEQGKPLVWVYERSVHSIQQLAAGTITVDGFIDAAPYPPSYFLLLYPFAFLTLAQSVFAFLLLSFTAWWWLLRSASFQQQFLGTRIAPEHRFQYIWWGTCNGCVIWALTFAQNSLLLAVLLLTGLMWRKHKPLLAGFCFGLLTVKPHYGLLIPVLLLVERNWRCFAVSAVVALVLVAASAAAFGLDAWPAYREMAAAFVQLLSLDLERQSMAMMSVANSLRLLGVPPQWAFGLHWLLVLPVVAIGMRRLLENRDESNKMALFLLLTLLLSPYFMLYDAAMIWAVVLYLAHRWRGDSSWWQVLLLGLLALFPLARLFGLPPTAAPWVLMGFAVMLMRSQPTKG